MHFGGARICESFSGEKKVLVLDFAGAGGGRVFEKKFKRIY